MDTGKNDSDDENKAAEKTDFWDELPVDVKQSIEIAQEELARGEGIPHQAVMAEIRARFLN